MVQLCGTRLLRLATLDHVGFLHHSILFSFTDMLNGLPWYFLVERRSYLNQ